MRLLFLGDIVGRSGRDFVCQRLPDLRRSLGLDFVVVNGENAAGGFGITRKICEQLFAAGVDVVTGGNHSWDQREVLAYINQEPRLLRPQNYPAGTPGRGSGLFEVRGRKVLVLNVMAQLFMESLGDPFSCVEGLLAKHRLGVTADVILLDFHGEATSEKMAMGHFVDGRASLCIGTHTHVPTADAMILPGGTGYMSDAGMCGDYDSIIGMEKSVALERFVKKLRGERLTPAQGPASLSGLYLETDDATGLAKQVEPVRLGGRLSESCPKPS